MKRLTTGIIAFAAGCTAAIATAEQAPEQAPASSQPAPACTVLPDGTKNKVVICPPGLEPESLRDAGAKACYFVAGCTAYFWDAAAAAPTTTPAPGEKFSSQDAAGMIAIWINDSKDLLLIKRAN